jgi:hypothetical protein
MLKIGVRNYISAATVSLTAGGSALGREPSNVKDGTITHWRATSPEATLRIDVTDSELETVILSFGDTFIDTGDGTVLGVDTNSIDLVSLHRIDFASSLTVRSYFANELISSETYNQGDLSGIETLHLLTRASGIINGVELEFSGGSTPPTIGYIWIGSQVEFEATAYQDSDESNDIASVSQGGYAGNSRRPLLRGMQVTLAHESSTEIKRKIRRIYQSGYSNSRPVARTEPCLQDEIMLGILDSKMVGYDFFDNKTSLGIKKAQATIGIAEVLGDI